MLAPEGAQPLRLWLHYGLWTLRARQIGTKPTLPLGSKVWQDIWQWSHSDCKIVLQDEISECERMWGSERRSRGHAGKDVFSSKVSGHWKVWCDRRWTQTTCRILSRVEEAQCQELRDGEWQWHSDHSLSLPWTTTAQHPRLFCDLGRIQNC